MREKSLGCSLASSPGLREPRDAANALNATSLKFPFASLWQRTHPWPPPAAAAMWANSAPECWEDRGRGLMKASRLEPESPIRRKPMHAAATAQVSCPRRARRLLAGLQRVICLQHVPSGLGPAAQGPPQSAGRVQNHVPFVSPDLSTRRGAHSV